jgi:threonine dehydrogenase-like Zn-dependent dehydrogenase
MIGRVVMDVLVCTAGTVGLMVVLVAGHFALRRDVRR